MQSKYEWLISLADDESDLDEIWNLAVSDSELDFVEKSIIADMLEERFCELKGR